nr:uncharacterized mitochondrial protein AtMg00810-like [Tanacetum cinerariifolium]
MSDEYFNSPPSVVPPVPVTAAPRPAGATGSPSSTLIDQATPSTKDMLEYSWMDAMQEEIHEFEGQDVWELVPCLDLVMIITLNPRGIFLNQSKYALEIIKKYSVESFDPVDTQMVKKSKLDADPQGKEVDPTRYHEMNGSLMYLTSSRPDLVFTICMCVRYQAKPTKKHLHADKRIFRYLR